MPIDKLLNLGFRYHGDGTWVYGTFMVGFGHTFGYKRTDKTDAFFIFGQELKTLPTIEKVIGLCQLGESGFLFA